MVAKLEAIDAAQGGALDVSAVGEAVRDVLDMPHGKRPARVVVDGQRKGVEDLIALRRAKQSAFFQQMGVDDLLHVAGETAGEAMGRSARFGAPGVGAARQR